MKKLIYIFIILIIFVYACIPIIDRVNPDVDLIISNPQIEVNESDTIYIHNIGEALKFIHLVKDNDQLDSIEIILNQLLPKNNIKEIYKKTQKFTGGRLYTDTLQIPTGSNTPLGNYSLILTCYDFSKNAKTISRRFEFRDERKPTTDKIQIDPAAFIKVEIETTAQDTLYIVCQNQRIKLNGFAVDNNKIRTVRASIALVENANKTIIYDTQTQLINKDTVLFDEALNNILAIYIPDEHKGREIENNDLLEFTLAISDLQNNISARSFTLKIGEQCDNKPPVIEGLQLSITPKDTIYELLEGANFRIVNGTVRDNQVLKKLNIQLRNGTTVKKDTTINFVAGTKQVALGTLLRNVYFSLPDFQKPAMSNQDNEYILALTAEDMANFTSKTTSLQFRIIEDEAPKLPPITFYINSQTPQTVVATLAPGQKLRIEGKIFEDYALEYVKIYWGLAGQERLVFDIPKDELTQLPYDYASDNKNRNVFDVPTATAIGANYPLRIVAKDIKRKAGKPGEEAVLEYRFVVR